MQLFHKISKIALVIFLVLGFFVADISPVLAIITPPTPLGLPSISSIFSEMEKRYHLNRESIQNQGEFFNVSDQKKIVPETSLSFTPSDPKEGEKISAKAFSIYYSNLEESLYYTWYLKHIGCDLRNNVTDEKILERCNASDLERGNADKTKREKPGDITVEDWKIEAARIIAQNGYEGPPASALADEDGFKAKFGGENKTDAPDRCYINDVQSGINYELVDSSSETTFDCPNGTTPVCVVVEPSDSTLCSVSGYPFCSSNVPTCLIGSPRCVDDQVRATLCSSFSVLSSCSQTTTTHVGKSCKHLFPHAPNQTSGDGVFNESEENFWGTDPRDPDTADNKNKDEANVVGLGNQTFKWNYVAGDQVGVAVEGTSMVQTKHDDSSFMIMWAFPKKDCPVSNKGSYTENIKGYEVVIPTASMDLDDCIERNLVDPAQGGQATRLEVDVTAIPENPINDGSQNIDGSKKDKAGDTVIAQASVSNAGRELTETLFEWKVQISKDVSFSTGGFKDITQQLRDAGLLGNTKGNALDSIAVKLDMTNKIEGLGDFDDYITNDIGYLRFKVDVAENFSKGIPRKGRSDVIVKFTSSSKKITAYLARPDPVSADSQQTPICENDTLDRSVCRIIKNEIIGLKIDPTGLSNFHWTINGNPLVCSRKYVSSDCADENDEKQNNVNFFPVTGNVGDTYTVTVTADDVSKISAEGNTGNTLSLTRTFHIVQPLVSIESMDKDIVWPKLLGQYKDITGEATSCPDGLCNDYSTFIFQAFSGGNLGFRIKFMPSFLRDISKWEWWLDGELIPEDPALPGELHFTADKPAGEIYNINFIAEAIQKDDVRKALLGIWNISVFESAEMKFSVSDQVEIKEPGIAQGPFQSERKYLAALISYIPASLLFTFRILLSAALVLFTTSFLYALLQDRRTNVFISDVPRDSP